MILFKTVAERILGRRIDSGELVEDVVGLALANHDQRLARIEEVWPDWQWPLRPETRDALVEREFRKTLSDAGVEIHDLPNDWNEYGSYSNPFGL